MQKEIGEILGAGREGAVTGVEQDNLVWLGILDLLALERGGRASSCSSRT